jgi:hypothetical protein
VLYSYLDDSVEEGQALGDAKHDEMKKSILTWMTVWKRARHWEMPSRMRVK